MPHADLLHDLVPHHDHPLAPLLSTWLDESKRFVGFVADHHSKIRKKIRETTDPETIRDLQVELESAYLLVQERQFSVVYEPYGRSGRSPDFAVSFTTSLTFNVEVTRLRPAPQSDDPANTVQREIERLGDTICHKLTQLLPQMSNVLIVQAEQLHLTDAALSAELSRLIRRAESRDTRFFARHGLRDTADFIKHYQRLSAILLRDAWEHLPYTQPLLWLNPQAKFPLPAKVQTALRRSHTRSSL